MATKTKSKAKEVQTFTPKELAEELDMSPKRLRAYLRQNFPRATESKNSSWKIDAKTADKVRDHYSASDDEDES